jgi:hypothetical protein
VHDAVTTPPRLENEAVTGAAVGGGAGTVSEGLSVSSARLDARTSSAVELGVGDEAGAIGAVVEIAGVTVVDGAADAATGVTRSAVPVITDETANHASATAATVQTSHVSGKSDRLATRRG